MKKYNLNVLSSFIAFALIISFGSCKKINESTQIGDDLIPPVDNVNTFEKSFATITDNKLFNDTAEFGFLDIAAVGELNDPEFGSTKATAYFDISSPSYGVYPFFANPDSVTIDSVILSLSYRGAYGDTFSTQTIKVHELAPFSTFNDSSFYRYTADPSGFVTVSELGTKTYSLLNLKDTQVAVRPRDTVRVANVIRIPLSNSIGHRLKSYDTTNAYKSDSAFKTRFKGFALDVTGGNALTYLDFNDQEKTRLIVYYRSQRNGIKDTTSAIFYHRNFIPVTVTKSPANFINGQANLIQRTPSGNYLATTSNASIEEPLLYIQSTPGSYATVKIPSLDTLSNKIVYRAELIVSKVSSVSDIIFTPPLSLFLDKINSTGDTAYVFHKDMLDNNGDVDFVKFGGSLRTDGTYRFNVTRHVQDIITRKQPNYTLRVYAPQRPVLYVPERNPAITTVISVNSRVANGRVVVAGGNHPDPALQMKLRIIYANIK